MNIKKYNLFTSVLVSVCIILFSLPSTANAEKKLEIEPIIQFPMLAGPTVIEMILQYFGERRIGKKKQYVVSKMSQGSAVAQYLCDLISDGETYYQPECGGGGNIKVYSDGMPTDLKSTQQAFKSGIPLISLQSVFLQLGLKTDVFVIEDYSNLEDEAFYKKNFKKVLTLIKKGNPVIFLMISDKGERHYLLGYGFDEGKKGIHYIDPSPKNIYLAKKTVSYHEMREGYRWYRKSMFWTGAFISVENKLGYKVRLR